jgi:hypothetical protein
MLAADQAGTSAALCPHIREVPDSDLDETTGYTVSNLSNRPKSFHENA